MNTKILLGCGATALAILTGPVVANASGGDYPPTSDDPGSVAVLPPAEREASEVAGADDPSDAVAGELPKTGGNDGRLLQIGGVTVLVGGALVAAAARRSRLSRTA